MLLARMCPSLIPECSIETCERGLEGANFESHISMFDLGMPPYGCFAIGLESLTAQVLNLPNVQPAVLCPRDRYVRAVSQRI